MSKYPNELDGNAELPAFIDNVTEISADSLNAIREAVILLQRTLGTNPQGGSQDLKTRLSVFFNEDGTPKQTALEAAGLIALPIGTSQIASNAGIQESKLDLDHSTQSLYNSIASANVAINANSASLITLLNDISLHFAGSESKHDGYDITYTGLVGVSGKDSVSKALNYIWEQFVNHRDLTSARHPATAITFTPSGSVTSTNVQSAIAEIDSFFKEDLRRHSDVAHGNGIASDGYEVTSQKNPGDLPLTPARLSFSPNSIKLAHIGAATVKSRGFDAAGLTASASTLAFTATLGSSSRSLTVSNIHTARYPTGYAYATIPAVVSYFNQQFINNTFPLTCFETKDGEIAFQMNIDNSDCSFTINNSSNSAATTLGFSGVLATSITKSARHAAYVNGSVYYSIPEAVSGSKTLASSASSIDVGASVSSLGLYSGMLFHVYNHTDSTQNGTRRITSVSGTSVTLASSVAAGTFNYVIYFDVADSAFTGNPKCVDLYVDSALKPYYNTRQETTLSVLSGLKVIGVSSNFQAATGTLTLNYSAPTYSLSLTISGSTGAVATFEQGYIGNVRVYTPAGDSYLDVFVFDVSPVTGADQVTFYAGLTDVEHLLIASTHTDASSTLLIPKDLRRLGVSDLSYDLKTPGNYLSEDLVALRDNGFVRGFSTSISSTSIVVEGGVAYVGGRKVSASKSTVPFISVASSDGTWNLVLFSDGDIRVIADSDAGYSYGDLLKRDDCLLICQATVASGAITVLADARFFVSKIDSKNDLVVDSTLRHGQFATLDAAILYVNSTSVKSDVYVAGDLSITGNLAVDTLTSVICSGDLSISGNLTVSGGCSFTVKGALTVGGDTTLSDCQLIVGSDSVLGLIDLGADSTLELLGDISLNHFTASGSNASVIGRGVRRSISSTGTVSTAMIVVSAGVSGLHLNNVEFIAPAAAFPVVNVTTTGNHDSFKLIDCIFRQSTAFTYPSATTGRDGVIVSASGTGTTNNWIVDGCTFQDLSAGLRFSSSSLRNSNLRITGCSFSNINSGIVIGGFSLQVTNLLIKDCTFTGVFNAMCGLTASTGTITGVVIEGCKVDNSDTSYGTPYFLSTDGNVTVVLVKDCIIKNCPQTIFSIAGRFHNFSDNFISSSAGLVWSFTGSALASVLGNIVSTHSGNVINTGSSTEISLARNDFSTSGTGTPFVLDGVVRASGNSFIDGGTSASTFSLLSDALFQNNVVSSGRLNMTAGSVSRSGIIVGNKFSGNGHTLTNTFNVLGIASDYATVFSDNTVDISGSLGSVGCVTLSGTGKLNFHNNIIRASTGNAILTISNSTAAVNISGNMLSATTAINYGIRCLGDNILISGNTTNGSFSTNEYLVEASSSNISVCGNTLNGTGSGAGLINVSSSATSISVSKNKNVLEKLSTSPFAGHMVDVSKWTVSASAQTITSAAADGYIMVPLNNLPVGAQLESVNLYVSTSGSSAITFSIYKRSSSSITAVSLGSVTSSSSAYQTLSVATAVPILDSNEYFAVIRATTTNNVIGQIVAHVRA
jgi:hypothetical protein